MVAHQADLERLWVMDLQQFLDATGPFDLATLVRHPHVPPATERLEEHQEITRPLTLVFAVLPPHLTWLHLLRWPHFAHQLLARFVHANLREARIIGKFVGLQNVFQAYTNAPLALG